MYEKGIYIDYNFVIYNRSNKRQKFSYKGAVFYIPCSNETLLDEEVEFFVKKHEIDKKVLFCINTNYFTVTYGSEHKVIKNDYLFKEVPEIIAIEDFINKKLTFPEKYKINQ